MGVSVGVCYQNKCRDLDNLEALSAMTLPMYFVPMRSVKRNSASDLF